MPYLQPSCPAMLYYCKPCHASPFDTRCSIFLPSMLFLQLSCHYLPYQGKPCHTLPLLAPYLQYACLSSCALLLTHKSFNIFGWLGRNWDATGGPDLWIHHFTGSSERGSQKASIQNALMNLNALKKNRLIGIFSLLPLVSRLLGSQIRSSPTRNPGSPLNERRSRNTRMLTFQLAHTVKNQLRWEYFGIPPVQGQSLVALL